MLNLPTSNDDEDWTPLYMSIIAGGSTCLGAAVVFCHPKAADGSRVVSERTMSFSLALAASVMVTVSVVSLGPECLQNPNSNENSPYEMMPFWSFNFLQRIISCGLGCAVYFLLSYFAFPEPDEVLGLETSNYSVLESEEKEDDLENSVKTSTESSKPIMRSRKKDLTTSHNDAEEAPLPSIAAEEGTKDFYGCDGKRKTNTNWKSWTSGTDLDKSQRRAWRVAMLLFLSLLCHNFPEGLAVAASALESQKLGITVTVGIMIHNIPEGIAIAIPCLAARPESPWLSFALASLSGLAEPAGAFVALLCLRKVSQQNDNASIINMENVLAFVAGIMVTVAIYELFPEAKRHTSKGYGHFVAGTIAGIVIMIATELYL